MHADLKWLAENVSEWGGTYNFKHIFLEDGGADYSSVPDDVVLRTFTRAQWQAARDELFTQRAAQRQRPNIKTQVTAWHAAEDEILASEMGGAEPCPENPFSSPQEDEAWREVEKKINPVWQSPHDAGGVCVFHGCRYSAHEQCYMCVLAGEAAKEEAKQPAYNPEDVAGVHYESPASKYHVQIKGQWVDVYDILTAYSVTNPADAHAIKKMLCPGQRGAKDGIQDRREAIASLERAIELEQGR